MNSPIMNNYRIMVQIGQGAYGRVYLAQDKTGKYVAIKKATLPALAEKRGCEIAKKLHQTMLVTYYDCFEEGGYFYIVMAYIQGVSLDKCTLTKKESKRFILVMLEFLRALKKQRVTYNDIKPANVIYASNGRFYLIDYGAMSAIYDESLPRFGSKAFASPEYLAGRTIDWRSDLYSLAKTIELVSPNLSKRQKRWVKKAKRQQKKHRFHTITGAKLAIQAAYAKTLCLGIVATLLVTTMFYQNAIAQKDISTLLTYYPYQSEGYRFYFENHDHTSFTTWHTIAQSHLFDIWDRFYLRQLSDELCRLDLLWTWDIQRQLLCHLSDRESQNKLRLLDGKLSYEEFYQNNESYSARLFLFRYCIDFAYFESEAWLNTALSKEKSIPYEEIVILNVQLALKDGQYETLKKSLDDLMTIDYLNKEYYQAKCALWIFDCGQYEIKWLIAAKQYLSGASEDERTRTLALVIEKRIAQWDL